MSFRQLISLILMTASLLSASVQSSNATCEEPSFDSLNATGSTSFPGFHPNGSVPGFQDSTWTLHTGLVDIVVPIDNSSFILQNWWLSTDPVITTPAAEFPLGGCTFLLNLDFQPKTGAPTTGSNTCENIFNDECQSAIIDMINSNITASGNTTSEELCASIMQSIETPQQCKQSTWFETHSQRKCFHASPSFPSIKLLTRPCVEPFGNSSFIPEDSCNTNVFNGSAKKGSLIETSSFSVPDGNYTYYDEYTKLVTPMIMTMWPKNSTTAWEPDTRLFCITASDIKAASRVPSSAISVQPVWSSLHALGAVMITALALL